MLYDQYRLPLLAANATSVWVAAESVTVYTTSEMIKNDKRCCSDRMLTLYHLYGTS
jgi:hypothetical protein